MSKINWYTYKATKPSYIQFIDELTMTVWDIPEYEDGFVIPLKGDHIWLGDKHFIVDHLTHNPSSGLLVVAIKQI